MVITKPTLLIVDDDASIRSTLTLIFSELGYDVRSAWDGLSALVLCWESAPEILLSDLNMPGMSGFELLSVVRRVYPAIYVVATSGSFSGKSVPPGVAADAFYEKATSLSVLFELIKQGAQPERAVRRSSDESTPIWMDPAGKLPSKGLYVLNGLSALPESIRKILVEQQQLVCEAECLRPEAPISNVTVQIADYATGANSGPTHSHGTIDLDGISIKLDVPSMVVTFKLDHSVAG